MQVEEFTKVVYVRHLRSVEPGKILVIWEGEIEQVHVANSEESSDSSNESRSRESNQAPTPQSESSGSDQDADVTEHSETFKVIGVLRDPDIQTLLNELIVRRDRGEHVTVRLTPEPTNVFDTRAICFEAHHNETWKRIGYVVREILEEVHSAINSGRIRNVEFEWVKYKLWKKAPGYYAAVSVTRTGPWSQSVHKARSTFS